MKTETAEEKFEVNKLVQLEKFPGKGGWTFVRIPEMPPDKKNPFGWRVVKGFIDNYELKQYRLMPMGNGTLFLPVKASIRKFLKKGEGDWIHVRLSPDLYKLEIPQEFMLCLEDAPPALENFMLFPEKEQKKYIMWVISAKTEKAKIERLTSAVTRIQTGQLLR